MKFQFEFHNGSKGILGNKSSSRRERKRGERVRPFEQLDESKKNNGGQRVKGKTSTSHPPTVSNLVNSP